MHKFISLVFAGCALLLSFAGAQAEPVYFPDSNLLLLDKVRVGGETHSNVLINLKTYEVLGAAASEEPQMAASCSLAEIDSGFRKLKSGLDFQQVQALFPCFLRIAPGALDSYRGLIVGPGGESGSSNVNLKFVMGPPRSGLVMWWIGNVD